MQALSELEAVNIALSLNGDREASEATEDSPANVAKALQFLRRTSRAVQARGWYFNTECKTIQRNADDEVFVGTDVFEVDATPWQDEIHPILRGNQVYDLKGNTFTFSKDPELEVKTFLDWDLVPAVAREYIAIKSARAFVLSEEGDINHARSAEMERGALRNLTEFDANQEDLTNRESPYTEYLFSERGVWGL